MKGYLAMMGEVMNILISEAMKDENWQQAINEEYNSLMNMKT